MGNTRYEIVRKIQQGLDNGYIFICWVKVDLLW